MHSILIAEDDPLLRRTVRAALEKDLGAEVIESADGAEALQRLKSESGRRIGLALIDLNMPVIDGMGLLRQIKKFMPKLPCIVLTGSDRMEDAVEAMQLGAADFISKPVQRARLITSVRNALELQTLKEEVKR
ncbi:MAG: response regulator, partial [Alphaproteobacteria bacterium]|nr:response regulator [Alphaproteobacteria bacterium]